MAEKRRRLLSRYCSVRLRGGFACQAETGGEAAEVRADAAAFEPVRRRAPHPKRFRILG